MPFVSEIYRSFQKTAIAVLDLILPPRCIGSGDIVDSQGTISSGFWQELHFIEAPFCALCGTPFSLDIEAGSLCASCIETEPEFDSARAAVIYNDASRKAVLDFKYGDRLHAVKTFVPWMQRAGQAQINLCDMIIPVPLHPRRLWGRRFNQAALLAQEIARLNKKLHLPHLLRRQRFTTTQKGLTRKERQINVRNAFIISKGLDNILAGKNILLIDDVFTSGATLNECARVLKTSGAQTVHVLTIARVTRDDAFSDN